MSIYAKVDELNTFDIVRSGPGGWSASFNLATQTATDLIGGGTVSITSVGNGWFRCSMSWTSTSSTARTHVIRLNNPAGTTTFLGDGVMGMYFWGIQTEVGAFPTSYIPTVASQVTRTADVAVMTGTNFSSWYTATEGTFFAEWTLGRDVTSVSIYTAEDGTSNNSIRTRYEAAGTANDSAVTVGGVIQATLAASNQQTLSTTYKNAMAYKVNDFARSASGASVVTDTSGTIPLVTQFSIGKNATNTEQPNGHIRQIAYYPRRLANAELQGITA
jgi:hypothetical protein